MKLIRMGCMESDASSKIRWVDCYNGQTGGTWKRGGKGKERVCLRQPIFYSVTQFISSSRIFFFKLQLLTPLFENS